MSRLDLIPDAAPADEVGADWLAVATEVADVLGRDVLERDRRNALPVTEIELLRDRRLLTISIPQEFGGEGLPWSAVLDVVRIIGRVDPSIAHILGYHYVWLRFIESFETPQALRALGDTVTHRWLWASPGNNRATGYPALIDESDQHRVTGDSGFATGAPVADQLFALTLAGDEKALVIVQVDPHDPAVSFDGEWDVLGQRLTASQSIAFADLVLGDESVLRRFGSVADEQDPRQSVQVLHFQHLFGLLQLAIAEGALLAAVEYTRQHTRPALHSSVERGRDEPAILDSYGRLVADVQALSALVERGARELSWLVDQKDAVTAEQRAHVAEIIASARIVSTEVGLEVTTAIFDLTGARSTATRFGLDRFWRNLRTLSLHDPVAYKRDEVGRFFVNGERPRPSGIR